MARPVGVFGRSWRWLWQNPRAFGLIAGGYATCMAISGIGWSIIGVLFVTLSGHSVDLPLKAIGELFALILLVHLPLLFSGILTLNGRAVGIWLGGEFSWC